MDEQPLPFGQETIMQEWRRWLSFVLAGTLSLAVSWTHAASVDPITKCQSAKLRAASREIAGKMKCEATASATGMPVDACLASAAGKADTAYSKAGTACVGDAGALHGAVDTCVATLVADVPGSGKCPAASVKAVGRGAGAQVKCRATDMSRPGSFAACDSRKDASTARALTRAGVCGQAPLAGIAAHIDGCDHALHDVVDPPPTTTTTTTTTSSTSTTTTTSSTSTTETSSTTTTTAGVVCGGGFLCRTSVTCAVGEECSANQSHDCICSPPPSCGSSAYPTCGGVCPDGLTCAPQYVDALLFNIYACACVPPDYTCANSIGSCGYGTCPLGSVCRVYHSFAGACSGGCGGP